MTYGRRQPEQSKNVVMFCQSDVVVVSSVVGHRCVDGVASRTVADFGNLHESPVNICKCCISGQPVMLRNGVQGM